MAHERVGREGTCAVPTQAAVAIRHAHFEDPGAFRLAIEAAGYRIDYRESGERESLTAVGQKADLPIVLGGRISAADDGRYPFLGEDLEVVARLEAAGRRSASVWAHRSLPVQPARTSSRATQKRSASRQSP